MLVTGKTELKNYTAPYRLWQGIPGIEVTKNGRVFLTFYSGGKGEQNGNYAVLLKSDDGLTYGEPVAAVFREDCRCYDPCIWIDPLDRLWFIWAQAPEHAVYAVICEKPDAEELVWSKIIRLGKDVMMNKPTVLSTGEWLFPIAVWNYNVKSMAGLDSEKEDTDRKAFVYQSVDNGVSFQKVGGADVPGRSFDEHMFLELRDGRIAMYVRTTYGIGVSYSADRGKTWTEGEDTGWGGPNSRFFIRRLPSGRILLVNHDQYDGRNNLTAMLSEDEGRSWRYKLLLDERSNVSYPDGAVCENGAIYLTYDRERGTHKSSLEEVYSCAREILVARITEQDIIDGTLTQEGSYLKHVASKLGEYALKYE